MPEALANKPVYLESDGTCVMEAENYAAASRGARTSTWRLSTERDGYAGKGHMRAPASRRGDTKRSSYAQAAALLYVVDIAKPGKYYVALRTNACCDRHDEVWLGVDGRQWPELPVGRTRKPLRGIANAWHWIWGRYPLGHLNAGLHILEVRRCEDYFELDRLMIADDPGKFAKMQPFEIGPPESKRGRSRD